MKNKGMVFLLILGLIVGLGLVGCQKITKGKVAKSDLDIKVEVFRGFYFAMTASPAPGVEGPCYEVEVTIANIGHQPVVFDSLEIAFIPKKGTPLKSITKPVQDDYIALAPGDKEEFHGTTNGYTIPLLVDAGKEPLVLLVSPQKNNQPVCPPFTMNLPELDELENVYDRYIERHKDKFKKDNSLES